MSKVFFWIVAIPVAAAMVVFSVNNRTDITLDLWPLDLTTAPLPVFSVVLAALFAGFVLGGLVAWASGGRARRRARQEARRAERATRDLEAAEARLETLRRRQAEADDENEERPRLPAAEG